MKKIIIIPILLILMFPCCEKYKNEDSRNVTFYTNAQFVLNCGPFDVEIYIDNSLVGVLKKPFLPENETPECNTNSNEAILTIEKPEGEYEFTAKLTCSENFNYLGDFKVKKDSCSLVYIDLTYNE